LTERELNKLLERRKADFEAWRYTIKAVPLFVK